MRNVYYVMFGVAIFVAVATLIAMAADSGTTSFSASIGGRLEITVADTTFNFGTIGPFSPSLIQTSLYEPGGGTSPPTTPANIHVYCNKKSGYTLSLANSGSPKGHMNDSSQKVNLGDALQVSISKSGGDPQSFNLENSPVTVDASGSKNNPAGTDYGAIYWQIFHDYDPYGSFAITLTYSVTPNA